MGSSPFDCTILLIDSWCNGSTEDFGSLSTGSNPVESAKLLKQFITPSPNLVWHLIWGQEQRQFKSDRGDHFNYNKIFILYDNDNK